MLAVPANTITLGVSNPPLGLTTTAAKSDAGKAGSESADGLVAGLPIWAWVVIGLGVLLIVLGLAASRSKTAN